MSKLDRSKLQGVWSAAPTPFTAEMKLDKAAVQRMVSHHLSLGVNGLFLAGTNGEGPWMTAGQRRELVAATVKHNKGRMVIAVQVTDNSAARILDNIDAARQDGADIAVIAPPNFQVMARPDVEAMYLEAISSSPLPVGIYDRGPDGPVQVPDAVLRTVYMQAKVVLVKDSSGDPVRRKIALACRSKRPELRLLTGCEFDCAEYLEAGYDGLLLGGGIFNGYLAGMILEAAQAGDFARTHKLQQRMNRMMFAVYGGKKLKCWLSGEKKLLVEMGLFGTWKNYPDFPLTESCVKAIARVIEKERDVLLPKRSR